MKPNALEGVSCFHLGHVNLPRYNLSFPLNSTEVPKDTVAVASKKCCVQYSLKVVLIFDLNYIKIDSHKGRMSCWINDWIKSKYEKLERRHHLFGSC